MAIPSLRDSREEIARLLRRTMAGSLGCSPPPGPSSSWTSRLEAELAAAMEGNVAAFGRARILVQALEAGDETRGLATTILRWVSAVLHVPYSEDDAWLHDPADDRWVDVRNGLTDSTTLAALPDAWQKFQTESWDNAATILGGLTPLTPLARWLVGLGLVHATLGNRRFHLRNCLLDWSREARAAAGGETVMTLELRAATVLAHLRLGDAVAAGLAAKEMSAVARTLPYAEPWQLLSETLTELVEIYDGAWPPQCSPYVSLTAARLPAPWWVGLSDRQTMHAATAAERQPETWHPIDLANLGANTNTRSSQPPHRQALQISRLSDHMTDGGLGTTRAVASLRQAQADVLLRCGDTKWGLRVARHALDLADAIPQADADLLEAVLVTLQCALLAYGLYDEMISVTRDRCEDIAGRAHLFYFGLAQCAVRRGGEATRLFKLALTRPVEDELVVIPDSVVRRWLDRAQQLPGQKVLP